ncbi:MAG: phosphoribosylamine--glycine ligase [Candidatus Ornithospirochaeta sp.]
MRILVLGSGAKDHAVAWWLSRSAYISELYMAPGNPGTADIAINLPDIDNSDCEAVYRAVKEHDIDLVFIGTEAPLLAGVREYLAERGVKCYGATKEAQKLEDDKAYARAFNERHGIPTPRSVLFVDIDSLEKHLGGSEDGKRYTIKSNSMSPSRVVLSSSDKNAILSYARILFSRGPVLLEDYVPGIHVTATLFMDKNGHLLLPLASEYTNVSHFEGTPTGGMGAIAPIPLKENLRKSIEDKIIIPTLKGMKEEGITYKGIITLSIVMNDSGPILVDYHVRLNDPATQAMLPIIKTDVVEILRAMDRDDLSSVKLETSNQCTVAVVMAAPGYPMQPEIGREIKALDYSFMMNANIKPLVFMGAVKQTSDGRYFTDGGRNITVVGCGDSLQDANEKAYALIGKKHLEPLWYRDDIGNKFFTWES